MFCNRTTKSTAPLRLRCWRNQDTVPEKRQSDIIPVYWNQPCHLDPNDHARSSLINLAGVERSKLSGSWNHTGYRKAASSMAMDDLGSSLHQSPRDLQVVCCTSALNPTWRSPVSHENSGVNDQRCPIHNAHGCKALACHHPIAGVPRDRRSIRRCSKGDVAHHDQSQQDARPSSMCGHLSPLSFVLPNVCQQNMLAGWRHQPTLVLTRPKASPAIIPTDCTTL